MVLLHLGDIFTVGLLQLADSFEIGLLHCVDSCVFGSVQCVDSFAVSLFHKLIVLRRVYNRES